jgi:hypothetical protein
MAKSKIMFGEWLPDQPGVSGAVTDAVNCYPVTNGYAPFQGEANYSNTAGADLLTSFAGRFGSVITVFAASASNLYKFDAGDTSLDPLTTTGYSNIEYWDVTQYGNKMIASNGADKLQAYELGVSTYFGNLAAAAPQAKYVTVVKDFVVAANVAGGNESTVYWSDINDETDWTPGAASQSDFQVIPDGGDITGLAGGEFGLIFLERAIYRMTYAGSPFFFQFDAISRTLGCVAPGSVAQFGGLTYFLADDGFYMTNGESMTNIGEEKVNRWFFDRVQRSNMRYAISSAVEPIKKLVIWCYPLQSGGFELLVYSIPLQKWSYVQTTAAAINTLMTATVTLENLDNYSASLDALVVSLDDPQWAGGILIFAGVSGQRIITFGNSKKTASVVSGDIDVGRSTVLLAKPIVDGGSASVAVASRDLLSEQVLFGDAVAADAENRCSLRSNGEYHRIKVTATGTNWKTLVGTEVEVVQQGTR